MNSIWNNNISAFQQRFPSLYDLYKDCIDFVNLNQEPENFAVVAPFFNLIPAKNGEISASENGMRLHSSYNPSKEAAAAINVPQIQEKQSLAFLGFGLGYHVLAAAKNFLDNSTNQKLILIEPDPLHFFSAMLIVDWTIVFKLPQLTLAVGCPIDNILALLEDTSKINIGTTGVSNTYFFEIPAFINHNLQYFNAVKTLVQRNIQKNKINESTLKKFGKLWVKNSLANLSQMKNCMPINIFENSPDSNNLPFLIIGAGPSLENIIPYLQAIKNKAILVCVETALHTLLRHNIEPDFLILMDPQYWAYKHIAGLRAPNTVLITEICTYSSVFRFDCKSIMLCSSQFPVGQFFQEKLNYFPGDLGTGGSVASSAWNFAHYCGAKEIYLAGLDLGFPGKQTHIKGSSAEQTFHKISDRINSAEKYGIGALFSANAQKDKNYLEKDIITDSRMKMFAWWFESRIANCPETKTFTLCPEGLKIPGIDICKIENFLSKPDISSQKHLFLNSAKKSVDLEKFPFKEFETLQENFPKNTDFFQKYPFLKNYF